MTGPVAWTLVVVTVALGLFVPKPVAAQRFLPDDPLWDDPDRLDMPVPVESSSSDYMRFLVNTFQGPGQSQSPAANVNTLGEVPNSSWYTNRHYRSPMTVPELRQGNTHETPVGMPPGLSAETWRVVAVTSTRATRSMIVEGDVGGTTHRYHMRFDPKGHLGLGTGASVVTNRAYYALGYNVPALHVVHVDPDRLEPGDGVVKSDLTNLLMSVAAGEEGLYRATVKRIPETVVKRIGPFKFHGMRPDDGNDVFPHEQRRELRGLRIAAAWLNHTGIRSTRTLDVAVEQDGRTFVRHYLYRTYESLGAATDGPKEPWMGHEHLVEFNPVLSRIGTLGLSGGDWIQAEYPSVEGVGRFGASYFRPEQWRAEHPNPAFARCDSADAFWMAKQIAYFTRTEIQAFVDAADYPTRQARDYVVTVLTARRDSIAKTYLDFGGGLDRFEVIGDTLTFQDVMARYGLDAAPALRQVVWHEYDNADETLGERIASGLARREAVPIPESTSDFLRVRFRTPGIGLTDVYLRQIGREGERGVYEVVGISRRATSDRS